MQRFYLSLIFILFCSSVLAGELKFSGKLSTYFDYYKGQTDDISSGNSPVLDGAGSTTQYTHRKIDFDELELQVKHKGQLSNGFNTNSVVVLELKSKNTFDIEEASSSIDNGTIKVSFGILQDEIKEYYGVAKDAINIGALEHTMGDEKPAVRLHYIGLDKLTLDTKARLYEKGTTGSTSTSPSRKVTELLLQSAYQDSWGLVSGSIAYENDKVINGSQYNSVNSGNKWEHTAKIYNFVLRPKYRIFNPFITYTKSISTDRAAKATTAATDTRIYNYILGLDLDAYENLILTAVYLHQVKYNYKNRELDAYSLAANYEMKPFEIQLAYSYSKNNASEIVSSNKDYTLSGVRAYVTYKF
ncbi:MAG: hypothetical protein U0T83_11090 [Bacteriovoracaceae bacterium]